MKNILDACKHGKETTEQVGTDPAKRAFYRAFRDFDPLNDLGIG